VILLFRLWGVRKRRTGYGFHYMFLFCFVFLWMRGEERMGLQHPGIGFCYFSLEMYEKGIQHPIVAYG